MIKLILTAIIALLATSSPAKTLDINTERAIYISGPIGGASSFDVANKIETLAKTKDDIYIVINSPGGEVVLGYLIINSMNVAKERGVKFVCYVPQLAASMSFQVFANCDERYTLPGAYLLWHSVRISSANTLTPQKTLQLYKELRRIEQRMVAELLSVMKVDRKFFFEHYLAETLWVAKSLSGKVPFFFTIVDDATGLTDDYQQFELRQRSPFGQHHGYKFIYESPYPITLIRQ